MLVITLMIRYVMSNDLQVVGLVMQWVVGLVMYADIVNMVVNMFLV